MVVTIVVTVGCSSWYCVKEYGIRFSGTVDVDGGMVVTGGRTVKSGCLNGGPNNGRVVDGVRVDEVKGIVVVAMLGDKYLVLSDESEDVNSGNLVTLS